MRYVGAHPGATAPEISHSLGMTAANIRHHLDMLTQSGELDCQSASSPNRRGRPAFRYAINTHHSEHNLDVLADALLTEWLCAVNEARFLEVVDQLAETLARPVHPSDPHLATRLKRAVDRLNAYHYQARWEAHSDAPHIFLSYCPYAAILAKHPELCLMDCRLINKLLGGMVHPVRLRSESPHADCVFILDP